MVRRTPPASRLGVATRDGFARLVHGEVIFLPGMPISHVFLVQSGALLVLSPCGEGLRRWVGPREAAGLVDLLSGGTWRGLGIAHGPTVLACFDVVPLRERLERAPPSHAALMHDLVSMAR
jgi:hypothetical protein